MYAPLASSNNLHTGHCESSQTSIVVAAPLSKEIAEPLAVSIVEVTAGFNLIPSRPEREAVVLSD